MRLAQFLIVGVVLLLLLDIQFQVVGVPTHQATAQPYFVYFYRPDPRSDPHKIQRVLIKISLGDIQ